MIAGLDENGKIHFMISEKVKFPLPWREGMKGRGIDG